MRLIDADAIKYYTERQCFGHGDYGDVMRAYKKDIDKMPTIDPETLRPTGRWDEEDESFAYYGRLVRCSECGVLLETHKKQYFKYCYNCGAKMMEE